MHQAATMCRKRGRIVLVGVTGLELSRADFYEKELSFQVSCSYGPGRYDPVYEEGGQDYPFGFVRWTEQRNFEAVLDMLADGRLDVKPLISHRFDLSQIEEAYQLVGGAGSSLGILLRHGGSGEHNEETIRKRTVTLAAPRASGKEVPVVGFIGSGNYATGMLIPAFKQANARLKSVASSAGVSGVHAGKKFGFEETTTDANSIINDESIDTVVITTRHNSHARFVCDALRAGKHVFVEKPLALFRSELEEIRTLYESLAQNGSAPLLMVGFNRRFAPHIVKIKSLLQNKPEPKTMIMTVNAGAIPADHWTQDRSVGGGRIIGEGCHFIDLLKYLAGSPIKSVQGVMIGDVPGVGIRDDKVSFNIAFEDGSFGTVHYFANGNKSFPKERLEIFCGGAILQMDNFRKLNGYGWSGFNKMNLWQQDKGNNACAEEFVKAIKTGKSSPVPVNELFEVTKATFDIVDILDS
jgi:predicted dehydrogenase